MAGKFDSQLPVEPCLVRWWPTQSEPLPSGLDLMPGVSL